MGSDRNADADTTIDVTVVIPTFNGERYLADVLDRVAEQTGVGTVETLVIDSGSTDDTLAIVRARPAVRLHEIPNREFGHGRTRNLGARLARGRVVAFLTQDATPASSGWLRELVAALDLPGVEGVVGRQVARKHAPPAIKYDIAAAFAAQGPPDRVTVVSSDGRSGSELDPLVFYSDVNSAARRAFLVDVLPLRDVAYSEDFAFARDLLTAGHRKAYAPGALVIHSNDVTVRGYARRMRDETAGLRGVGEAVPRWLFVGAMLRAARAACRDAAHILRDPEYSWPARLRWLAVNPWFHVARWWGMWRGGRKTG